MQPVVETGISREDVREIEEVDPLQLNDTEISELDNSTRRFNGICEEEMDEVEVGREHFQLPYQDPDYDEVESYQQYVDPSPDELSMQGM